MANKKVKAEVVGWDKKWGTEPAMLEPISPKFSKSLDTQAAVLCDKMLTLAHLSNDIRVHARAIEAYGRYKNITRDDLVAVIDKLMSMSDPDKRLLSVQLKKQGLLEKANKSGLTLSDAYNLTNRTKPSPAKQKVN